MRGFCIAGLGACLALAPVFAPYRANAAPVHTTYLWHMHQPIYWPDRSDLGNEDSNNWCGWFNQSETVLAADIQSASGSYLEGLVKLETHLGSPRPDTLYLAVAAYQSPDGGTLQAQAPGGDANVETIEYVVFPPTVVGVAPEDPTGEPATRALLVSTRPNPFSAGVRIELLPGGVDAGGSSVDIFDVYGRKIRTLTDEGRGAGGETGGGGAATVFSWDGRDASGRDVSAGLYFVRATHAGRTEIEKIVLLR